MQKRLFTLLFIVFFVVISQPVAAQNSPTLRVHFIDVGQGDSILVQTSTTAVLIDGGNANGLALSYLQAVGIDHLDAVIASHPHADHIGGLIQVMSAMPVSAVWTSGASHTTTTYELFLDTIINHQIPYFEAAQNDVITVGDLSFDVLYARSNAGDLNNTSLVLHLVYGQASFLFTGDAEAEVESQILATVELLRIVSTVLKVGHHGSSTSSTPAFLNAVQPQIAVYSAGAGNSYGHPHQSTISNLTVVGAVIYGTDTQGTIIVETTGVEVTISTVHNTQQVTSSEIVSTSDVVSDTVSQPVLNYDPNGQDRDCGDFPTHDAAQAFFVAAGGPDSDRHRLDGDNDGIACESLP